MLAVVVRYLESILAHIGNVQTKWIFLDDKNWQNYQ